MRKILMFVFVLIVCNLTLFAQTGQSPRIVHTKEKSEIHVPPQEAPAGLRKIYSNLGKSRPNLYLDNYGWGVTGPNSIQGYAEFVGMPFTPKSDSHVSQVQVAVQWNGTGANQVNLSIYWDLNGVPGMLLAGPVTVTNLPDFGTCCTLAVANFSPLAISGGVRYWVVADTPASGTGSDFMGSWDFVVQGKIPPMAYGGSPWYLFPTLEEPAGEVLGSIP